MDEKEQAELKTVSPQHWLEEVSSEYMKALPKSNQENKEIQELKAKLKKLKVRVSKKDTLEVLREKLKAALEK